MPMPSRLRNFDGVENFEESDAFPDPDLDRETRFGFYAYDFKPAGVSRESPYVNFIGCEQLIENGEPVPGAVLYMELGAPEDEFDDAFADFVDVINGITFGGDETDTGDQDDNQDQTDTGDGLTDTGYVDPTYHFGVEFGEGMDPRLTANEDGDQNGVGFGDGFTMTVRSWEGSRARTCVNDAIGAFEELSIDGDSNDADDVELPDSPDAERTGLVSMTYQNTDADEYTVLGYAECRPMVVDDEEVEDVFLLVTYLVAEDDWDSNLDTLQDVLDSIAFDASADNDTDLNDDEDQGSGGSFSSTFGYTITWDDAVYTYAPFDESQPDGGFTLSRPEAILTFQAAADPTLRDCVNAELDVVEQLDGMGELDRERDVETLTGSDDGVSRFYSGEAELGGEDTPVLVYIECRPLVGEIDGNQLALVIRMVIIQDEYETIQPDLQDLLDGIEITEP